MRSVTAAPNREAVAVRTLAQTRSATVLTAVRWELACALELPPQPASGKPHSNRARIVRRLTGAPDPTVYPSPLPESAASPAPEATSAPPADAPGPAGGAPPGI